MDYKLLYKIIGNSTPLHSDCGVLCDKACCKGDKNTGMLLFPGESTTLDVIAEDNIRLAVCKGSCKRCERPLSCRIFPFFPVKNEKKCAVVPDYRGYKICPLIEHSGLVRFSRIFKLKLKLVSYILYTDKECADFCNGINEDIISCKKLLELTGELYE